MKKRNIEIKKDNYWYLRTVDEVFLELNSSKNGLEENEAKKRLELYGKNKLSSEKSFAWRRILFDKINSILIYILFGSSVIAFLSKEMLEFYIIIIIIFMTVFLGFFQEYKADRTIKALNSLTAKKVSVLRNGIKKDILAHDLVIGDIVYLKRGDIVPADLRIIESGGLQINEAIITGESLDRVKIKEHLSEQNTSVADMINMAFSSTSVTAGNGIGIVVETGLDTFIGKISLSIESIKNEKSPIQKKVDGMSKMISYIVITVAVILFVILLLKGNSLYFSLILVSAVAISGIPESFPLALTFTFSNGIKKMAKQNAIVKDLNSVETLGTTTVICTDKTGTLTENKMRVVNVYLPSGTNYLIKGSGYDPKNEFYLNDKKKYRKEIEISQNFTNVAVLCNDSSIALKDNEWLLSGEPTEGALVTLAKSLDVDENVLREDNKRVFVLPFDPLKKFMVTVHENMDKKNGYDFYMKGAGEIVLEKCSFVRVGEKILKLDDKIKNNIILSIEDCNKNGLRVLSLASKKVKCANLDKKDFLDNLEKTDFIYEGFVAIEDPIREEVYHAVNECHKAGIKIVMITGDHKLIAKHIGEKLNLFNHSTNKIFEGYEIDKLTDSELDAIIKDVSIFARTTPEHKLRIVNSFQRLGEIVAMTGDGVNDAPALKKADIGVSMGKNGTDVAREASNMVLTDDNFATIVKAVKEGRTVYSNVRRFVYYFLAGNFSEVAIIFIAVVFGLNIPLTALMILFVNVVTSTIPALALSIEPTHDKVMNQRPRNPKEKLLSGYILTKILITIPFLVIGTLGLFLWELFIAEGSLPKAMTFAFASIITFELFHAFNSRRLHTTIFDKKFFSNPYFFLSIGTSFVLMLMTIYTEIGQLIFKTVPLLFSDWLVIIAVTSMVIVFTEIVKISIKSEFEEQSSLKGINITFE